MTDTLYRTELVGERLRLTPVVGGKPVSVKFSTQDTQAGCLSSSEAWGRGLVPVAAFASEAEIPGHMQFVALYYRTADREQTGTLPEFLEKRTNLLPGESVEHGRPAGICPILPVEIE